MEQIKLHLGCGSKRIKGYTNIDVRPLDAVDLVTDIRQLVDFEKNSVSLIYASHVLEHFGRLEYMDVLRRWYEVLRQGGVLRLAVPNFEAVVEHYNQFKELPKVMGLLYGGQTYPQNYHYCTWDYKTLTNDLKSIGFKDVVKYDWQKTEHSDIDDYSQCYLPHMDKENGKLMSLNIEATK